jgi:hypothetical protein
MRKFPLNEPILPIDYISSAKASVQSGKPVSGDDLLAAIEQSLPFGLAEELRTLVRQSNIPAAKSRGRRRSFDAALDVTLDTVDKRHAGLLRKYQEESRKKKADARKVRAILPKTEQPPSERAYRRIASTMQEELKRIDWKALRNLHVRWKKGDFHSAENHVDPTDFDAEIERKFPAPTRRS